jgi:hypothetical protein
MQHRLSKLYSLQSDNMIGETPEDMDKQKDAIKSEEVVLSLSDAFHSEETFIQSLGRQADRFEVLLNVG